MADGNLHPNKELAAAHAMRQSLGTDDLDLLSDMIEGETSLFEMMDFVLEKIGEDQELLDGISARKDRIDTRRIRIERRQKLLKAILEQSLTILERDRVERPEATISLRKNQDKLVINEESEVPTQFWKAGDPRLDKANLKAALKGLEEGDEPIPGASLEPQPRTIQIRTR